MFLLADNFQWHCLQKLSTNFLSPVPSSVIFSILFYSFCLSFFFLWPSLFIVTLHNIQEYIITIFSFDLWQTNSNLINFKSRHNPRYLCVTDLLYTAKVSQSRVLRKAFQYLSWNLKKSNRHFYVWSKITLLIAHISFEKSVSYGHLGSLDFIDYFFFYHNLQIKWHWLLKK